MIYALVIICAISAGVCHWIARRRGASAAPWIAAAALIGPLAIPLAYLCVRPKRDSAP